MTDYGEAPQCAWPAIKGPDSDLISDTKYNDIQLQFHCIIALSSPEKYFLDDPDFEDKVPLYFLSHKEMYEETVRKSALAFQKIRKLQEEGNDGIDNYM